MRSWVRHAVVKVKIRCITALFILLLFPFLQARGQDTFTVTVANKTAEHPYSGRGWPEGYVIDGDQGKTLTLVRGRTYTFQMENVPSIHPFYLTTIEGGAGAGEYTEGVEGSGATGNQTLTFTPSESTPDLLYYECMVHEFMGGQLSIVDESEMEAEVELELLAEGLVHPVALAEPVDETGRRFIADQTGQIYVLAADGTLMEEPFLDIQNRLVQLNPGYDERGLLGLAFHPNYAENGRFFVYYSAPLREGAPPDFNHTSILSEFTVSSGDPNVADSASEQVLLQVDQPQGNHNAGTLAFGQDGFLYISLGDGGGRDDEGTGHVEDWYDANVGGNAQDIMQNLLGSILRIDVDNPEEGMNYGIPDDNPFTDIAGLGEQWAYGFRNPYRFSFDMGGTNEMFVGDAGQELWEEVSIVEQGGNYGWNVKEGTHCFDAEDPQNPPAECPDVVGSGHPAEGDPLIDPVIEFANAKQEGGLGFVVVGGHVYRGSELPEFDGQYFFGTWSRGSGMVGGETVNLPGRIFVAQRPANAGEMWPFQEVSFSNVDSLSHYILSFGQDRRGEVYVLTTDEVGPTGNTGRVYQFVAPGAPTAGESDPVLPSSIVLEQNYPNPFNPNTTIQYSLDRSAQVTLRIYDVLGRQVTTLVNQEVAPGTYTISWDGRDAAGKLVSSGVYLYRLETGTTTQTRTMTLLR